MRMRKIALVICEGETEVSYINLLKKWYKSPIRIVSHIEGTKITPTLVNNRTKELKISLWDKVYTFLMYDMDVAAINEKVMACKAEMLLSNPCFEIWLLLHAKDQKTAITTENLIKDLKKCASVWKNYTKSDFTETQQIFLKGNTDMAVKRSKRLKEFQNPSTGIYKLIDLLKGQIKGPIDMPFEVYHKRCSIGVP